MSSNNPIDLTTSQYNVLDQFTDVKSISMDLTNQKSLTEYFDQYHHHEMYNSKQTYHKSSFTTTYPKIGSQRKYRYKLYIVTDTTFKASKLHVVVADEHLYEIDLRELEPYCQCGCHSWNIAKRFLNRQCLQNDQYTQDLIDRTRVYKELQETRIPDKSKSKYWLLALTIPILSVAFFGYKKLKK